MPANIVQLKSGVQNTAVSSLAVSFDAPVSIGNQIIIIYVGNSLISEQNVPAGFTEPVGGRQEGPFGHNYWHKVASGGEQTFTLTLNTATFFTWSIMEVSGLSGVASLLDSAGQESGMTHNAFPSPTLIPSSGERFIIASFGAFKDSTSLSVASLSNGFMEQVDIFATDQSISDSLTIGTLSQTFNGSQSISTTATYDWFATALFNTSMIMVYNVGPPDVTPPTTPTNLHVTGRTDSTLALSWNASTDNVQVQHYDIFLNGSLTPAATTTSTTYLLDELTPTTTYTIRVRATDVISLSSPLSAPLTVSTIEGKGEYYWDGNSRRLTVKRVYDPANHINALARIPWEGGPAYWNQFSKAAAAGWNDPSFFPIGIDPAPFSGSSEIQWDKAHGINFYNGGLNTSTDWRLLEANDMFFIGDVYTYAPENVTMPLDYAQLVGYRLGDETDGVYQNPQDGYDHLQELVDTYSARNDGRFMYNNYTQMTVLSNWPYKDRYVNDFTDVVSMDMYWYTIPDSSFGQPYISSVKGPVNPRSATSYGAMVRGLREVDEYDGVKQPIWFFVENLSGGPGEQFVRYLTTGELKGAAMSSIINEARGLVWFNAAMSGPPNGSPYGNVIRHAQYDNSFVGVEHVEAMGEVNNQIHSLAEVINTQSYVWSCGVNLETMVKVHAGYLYIFAMAANGTNPGVRTLRLPDGVSGENAEVVGENRTISVPGNRMFTDTFAYEYTYHIYKIAL